MELDLGDPDLGSAEWVNGAACNVRQLHAANAVEAGDIEQASKIPGPAAAGRPTGAKPDGHGNSLAIMADNRARAAILSLFRGLRPNSSSIALSSGSAVVSRGRPALCAGVSGIHDVQPVPGDREDGVPGNRTLAATTRSRGMVWRDLCGTDHLGQFECLRNIVACWDVPTITRWPSRTAGDAAAANTVPPPHAATNDRL